MRLDFNFAALDRLRQRMEAPLQDWQASIGLGRVKDIVYEPHEREIENLEELDVGPGDTIIREGRRVFLYIREFYVNAETFEEACSDPEKLRKFHIVWCKTLHEMMVSTTFKLAKLSRCISKATIKSCHTLLTQALSRDKPRKFY